MSAEMIEQEMTDAGAASVPVVDAIPTHGAHSMPRQVKGGVFAPSDMEVIKRALHFFIQEAHPLTDSEERQITNLLHRLGRID
jgi:hypothetical protein